jgi:hypothetical protein
MTLCDEAKAKGGERYHRWDAQKALAKGGVEDGDLCDCGAVAFGMNHAGEHEECQKTINMLVAQKNDLMGCWRALIAIQRLADAHNADKRSPATMQDIWTLATQALSPPSVPESGA